MNSTEIITWYAHNQCGDLFSYDKFPDEEFAVIWVKSHDNENTTWMYGSYTPFEFEHQFQKWVDEQPHYTGDG